MSPRKDPSLNSTVRGRFAREGVAAGCGIRRGIQRGTSAAPFVRGPSRWVNFRAERISSVLADSSSAVYCMLTAENIPESWWTGAGGTGESRTEV
jgi:hypothetical protein